jgi:hypothetical protein
MSEFEIIAPVDGRVYAMLFEDFVGRHRCGTHHG